MCSYALGLVPPAAAETATRARRARWCHTQRSAKPFASRHGPAKSQLLIINYFQNFRIHRWRICYRVVWPGRERHGALYGSNPVALVAHMLMTSTVPILGDRNLVRSTTHRASRFSLPLQRKIHINLQGIGPLEYDKLINNI
jgi:hypothetical protein